MAAGLFLFQLNGSGGATTFLNDGLFAWKSVDSSSTDASASAVALPQDAINSPNFSYEVFLNWELDSISAGGYLTNFKIFGPIISPAASVEIIIGTIASYSPPINTESAVPHATQHIHYTDLGEGNYLFLTVVPGDNRLDTVGEKTNFCMLQLATYSAASTIPGNTTLRLSYEEI